VVKNLRYKKFLIKYLSTKSGGLAPVISRMERYYITV